MTLLLVNNAIIINFRELSSKEALWMQQQGEATNTVERINGLQTSLQQLT